MKAKIISKKDYFELTGNNSVQLVVFLILTAVGIVGSYLLLTPLLELIFVDYLGGNVYKIEGESVKYMLESSTRMKITDPYFNWAVDVYIGSPQEARYWFNPVLSLSIPCIMIGAVLASLLTSILPSNIGYIRQKIERETASLLDYLSMKVFGFHGEEERGEIVQEILDADLRDLHDFEKKWRMPVDDLISLHKGIKWQTYNFLKRVWKLNDGIRLYMRFYVTQKYSNSILGLVYFGAAVLILIIGLRGLKFIPQMEPSLVFFSLGLEFSMLVLFALTLLYGKEENEEHFTDNDKQDNRSLGDSKEAERMLRLFIKSNNKSN